ncbi:MAG: L-histidine N(alpha)-methyltransferase [Acidocella sp.]|nr:L-histidine N(alpha)-methyltransferase [Acidocella sp.]
MTGNQALQRDLGHGGSAHTGQNSAIRAELVGGLLSHNASIHAKYFYDALGSKLFEAIGLLDEYDLGRAEAGIFAADAQHITAAAGVDRVFIDLGAGNCAKASSLFATLKPSHYVAVDIAADFLTEAVNRLQAEHPEIPMQAVALDFSETFSLPTAVPAARRLFFYPGSSIGNFTPLQAVQFFGRVRAACGADGAILVGVDLVKDAARLEAAYDDPLGVTAAFNLNILRHVNRLIGTDFIPTQWRHVALFNADQSRIEMHLEARCALRVTWPGGQRAFAAGARIHTENSYKYTQAGFISLLGQAGFSRTQCWTDAQNQFLVCYAKAN